MFNKLIIRIRSLLTKISSSALQHFVKNKKTYKNKHELYNKEQTAIHKFHELYTGKQRTNREIWLDYFTSEEFLYVYQENKFVSMLYDTIKENIEEFPLNKEFLKILYSVYGLNNNYEYIPEKEDINKYITAIAKMGPKIPRYNANDLLFASGFDDYYQLLFLKQNNSWNDYSFKKFKDIIDHYQLHNISDIPLQHNGKYKSNIRHPKTIRLITYFFENADIPNQAYQILWKRLCLETATNGRNKLLYGRLREIALEHIKELSDKPKFNTRDAVNAFLKLNMKDNKNIDDFFEQKNITLALMDEEFVNERVQHWINDLCSDYFIKKLEQFYTSHINAPYRKTLLETINLWKKQEKINKEIEKDENSEITLKQFDINQRAYLRYYLNTAFYETYGIKTHGSLAGYLYNNMPYSDKWSKKFIEKNGFSSEHPIQIHFGDNTLNIIFHRKFIEYLWNDSPCVPHLKWEEIINFTEETKFFLLLPITKASYFKYSDVYNTLLSRLKNLPVDVEASAIIADCIASKICQNEDDNSVIYNFFAETEELLYVCSIYNNNTIKLCQIKNYNTIELPNNIYHAPNINTAVKMGLRLLNEYTASYPTLVPITKMPNHIFIKYKQQPPKYLKNECITNKTLNTTMEEYFSQNAIRVEISWNNTDLVFMNDNNKHTCICFDNRTSHWYALVALPEIYSTVDSKDVIYVPFGLGMLPNYLIHQNLNIIKQKLNDIFQTVPNIYENTGAVILMWSPHTYFSAVSVRYNLAKRLYGGYDADKVYNQISDRFYIPETPNYISYTDLENNNFENTSCRKNHAEEALAKYMIGKLHKLTLTWQYEETNQYKETINQKRHIHLIQGNGIHQMFYVDDVKNASYYLISNINEYLKAEGKKYHKVSFLGEIVPGHLVHYNLQKIRNYLDLLLSQIKSPDAILNIFGEFSYQKNQ